MGHILEGLDGMEAGLDALVGTEGLDGGTAVDGTGGSHGR
jgi:hypothetical protein